MYLFKKAIPLVLGICLAAGSVFAQGQPLQQNQNTEADSVSDAELKKFVKTAKDLQEIQQNIQGQVQKMVKQEGMEFERFQKIMMSQQNPQMAQNVEVTEEEEATIKELQSKLQEIGQKAQKKQLSIIQDHGFSPQRFQQIAQALQSDPEMMQRFQKMSSDSLGS